MQLLIAGLVLLLQTAATTPTPIPCSQAEHHQFDFWIGDWEVRDPEGKLEGTNRIEPILGGCALKESWTGAGMTGTSYNAWSRDRGWHQTWIDDRGSMLLLDGGLQGDKMVLTGKRRGPKGEITNRITWSRLEGDRVRQLWEQSKDGGKTWQVAFDGIYSKKR